LMIAVSSHSCYDYWIDKTAGFFLYSTHIKK